MKGINGRKSHTDGGGRKTYTVEEAGQLLGIGRNQAYEAARNKQLPAVRIGKRWLVLKEPLDRMLEGSIPQ
jgi:excisionase family DNA binding protein